MSQRLRELAEEIGYRGGKTVFDDYVREMRPRFFAKRTFQRTIYRPAELIQCDFGSDRVRATLTQELSTPYQGADHSYRLCRRAAVWPP